MKKNSYLIFLIVSAKVLIMQIFLLTAFFVNTAASSVNKALDIVLVIDKSGSMANSDKNNVRLEAAKLFGYLCSSEDRVAVVEFSTNTKEIYPLSQIQNLNNKNNNFSTVIDGINYNNDNQYTRIDLALEAAYKIIKKSGSERIPIIILLTDGTFDGDGDTPKNLADTLEKRVTIIKNKIDDYVNKCKNENIRIYTIGLGFNGKTEAKSKEKYLEEISKETNAFYLSAESGDLIEIYKKIFIDITSRFILAINASSANENKKLSVSSFDREVVTILLNPDYKIGRKIAAEGIFTAAAGSEAQKAEPINKTSKNMDLFWFYKLINPGNGVLNLNFDFDKFLNFHLWIIRNLAIDINVQEPVKREFFEQEPIKFQLQVLVYDAAKNINFNEQIKVKLEIKDPSDKIEEIDLSAAGNGGEYFGSYTPKYAGEYRFIFKTIYYDSDSKQAYMNSKYMDIKIKPKEKYMIKVWKLPSQNCTLGSNTLLRFSIIKELTNTVLKKAEIDGKKINVSSYLEVNGKKKPPVDLKFVQTEYQSGLSFTETGDYLLKINVSAPNSICRDFEQKFSVSEKPSIVFESPSKERIITPEEATIEVRTIFSKKDDPRPSEINGELIFNEGLPEVIVLKKIPGKEDVYKFDRSFVEGNYKLNVWFNYLDSRVEDSIDFYVYNVSKPVIELRFIDANERRAILMAVKPMPDSSARNYEVQIGGYVEKPDGGTESISLIKSPGKDLYEGNIIPYSLGDYNFIAEAYYPEIKVPEGFNPLYANAVGPIKYEITEINGKSDKKYSEGKIIFDISTVQNIAGCSDKGQMTLKINCYKPGYKLSIAAAENNNFKIYSDNNQFYNLNHGINDIELPYTVNVDKNDTPITQELALKFMYSDNLEDTETENIVLLGVGHKSEGIIDQLIPYLILFVLIILILYRKIKLNKQKFNFNIQVMNSRKTQNIDHEDINDYMSPFFINILSWKKSIKIEYNKESEGSEDGDADIINLGGQSDILIYCDDPEENSWSVQLSEDFYDAFESGPNYYIKDAQNQKIVPDADIGINDRLEITLNSHMNKINIKFIEKKVSDDSDIIPKISDNDGSDD